MKQKIVIRNMKEEELQMVMGWAAKENWNPGKYDYKSYYSMDERGYLLLLVDDKPVGSISVVRYSETFSFMGLFIVLPEYRSKGLGKQLWEAALKYLESSNTIGLYAVPQQVSRYKNSGFKEYYSNNRWGRKLSEGKENTSTLKKDSSYPHVMFKNIIEYDKSVFKYDREKLLNCMLSMPQTFTVVSWEKEGGINGYGIIRPCETGFRIGPLYANDLDSAKSLCELLLAKIPGQSIIIDIPTPNIFGSMFAEYFNLEPISVANTVAMFKEQEPTQMEQSAVKCYGVTSLELG